MERDKGGDSGGANNVLELLRDPLLDVDNVDASNIKVELLDEDEADMLVDQEVLEEYVKEKSGKSKRRVASSKGKKIKRKKMNWSFRLTKEYQKEKLKDAMLSEGTQDKHGVWICNICKKPFITNSTFIHHVKRTHKRASGGVFNYKCDMCSKEYIFKNSLKHHKLRIHHQSKDGEMTAKEEIFLQGQGKKNDIGKWNCMKCGLQFQGNIRFAYHLARSHQIKPESFKYKCDICNMDFRAKWGVRMHIQKTHSKKPEDEEKLMLEETMLSLHGKKDNDDYWWCQNCGTRCYTQSKFIYHLKRFHNVEVTSFDHKCIICGLEFTNERSLLKHMDMKHTESDESKVAKEKEQELIKLFSKSNENGSLSCTKCGKTAKGDVRFLYHLTRVHNMKITSFNHKCPVCGIEFRAARGLACHIKQAHEGDFELPEKKIEKRNSSKSSEVMNTSESSQSCTDSADDMQGHGKKDKYGNWLCNDCCAMYNKRSSLVIHLKKVHHLDIAAPLVRSRTTPSYTPTETKLSDASVMDESCTEEESEKLLEHGKKTDTDCWECNHCKYAFSEAFRFMYHLKRTHDIAVRKFQFKCKKCSKDFFTGKALGRHIENMHPKGDEVSCGDTLKDDEIIAKEGSRCPDGGWVCNRCGTKYARDSMFMYHLKRYHGVDLGSFAYECDYCDLDFRAASGLQYHMLNKHSKEYKEHNEKMLLSTKISQQDKKNVKGSINDSDEDDDNIALSELRKETPSSDKPLTIKKRRRKKVEIAKEKSSRIKLQELELEIMNREGKKDKEGSWWCNRCGLRYSKDGVFLYHLKRAHDILIGSFEYKCTYCKMEFISKPALRTHINRTHPEANESLLKNTSDFLKESILQNHNKIIETNFDKDPNNQWVCKMCGSKFIKTRMCLYHLKRDHDIFIEGFDYKCNLCHLDYNNPSALRIHVKRMHGANEDKILENCVFKNDQWECKWCDKTFLKRASFAYHFAKYHETKDQIFKYQCKLCQSKYISPKGLQQHLITVHGQTDTGNNVEIIKHESEPQLGGVKLNISINKIKTEDKIMNRCTILPGDMTSGNNQDGIHQCNACGYLLSSRKNLMEHIQTLHCSEYDAIVTVLNAIELKEESLCKVCGKIFFSVAEFQRHVKAEHKREDCLEKLLECRFCIFFTMSQFVFEMHLKTIHSIPNDSVSLWPCRKCGLEFDHRDDLLSHVTEGPCYVLFVNGNIYKCVECSLEYQLKSELIKHVEEFHISVIVKCDNNKELNNFATVSSECTKCPHCDVNLTYSELYSHLAKNHPDHKDYLIKHHDCNICKKTYSELSQLKAHIDEMHAFRDDISLIVKKEKTEINAEEVAEYKCAHCELVLSDNTSLLAHISKEHGAKKNPVTNNPVCSLCMQEFTSNSSLRRHIKVIHISQSKISHIEKKPSSCIVCSNTFRSEFAMLNHFRLVHIDDPFIKSNDCYEIVVGSSKGKKNKNAYKCKLCTFSAKLSTNMDIHLISKHWTGIKPVLCSYCDHQMATQNQLQKHLYTNHPDSQQAKDCTCLCDECGKTFNNKMTFYQHRESHNTPKYKCEYCDYSTHLKTSIDNHRRKHSNEKPFKCNFESCNFSSAHHTTLKMHTYTHYPEKYMQSCEICGFKTVNKYTFNGHVKQHKKGGEHLFSCEHCAYSTADKSHLILHCKTHAEAKTCQLCDFSTKYKQTMKKHLKKRHGVIISKQEEVKWF